MKVKYDIKTIESRLNKIKKEKNECNKIFQDILLNVIKKDTPNISYDILKNDLFENDMDYILKNDAYIRYISQYSKEYIEMSEWYYGPELPYEVYLKEFKKENQSYLADNNSIKELYALFIFYGLFQYYLPREDSFSL